MEKPAFLYHGSKVEVDILIPHKAYGLPEELGTEYGVYALESFEMARRFALLIKPLPNGTMAINFDDSTGKVTIKAGTLDRDSIGYVYKVPSDTFVKIDDHQWISICDVVPLEKTVVNTDDLWSEISFG
jgi:hypothetical protein